MRDSAQASQKSCEVFVPDSSSPRSTSNLIKHNSFLYAGESNQEAHRPSFRHANTVMVVYTDTPVL